MKRVLERCAAHPSSHFVSGELIPRPLLLRVPRFEHKLQFWLTCTSPLRGEVREAGRTPRTSALYISRTTVCTASPKGNWPGTQLALLHFLGLGSLTLWFNPTAFHPQPHASKPFSSVLMPLHPSTLPGSPRHARMFQPAERKCAQRDGKPLLLPAQQAAPQCQRLFCTVAQAFPS